MAECYYDHEEDRLVQSLVLPLRLCGVGSSSQEIEYWECGCSEVARIVTAG